MLLPLFQSQDAFSVFIRKMEEAGIEISFEQIQEGFDKLAHFIGTAGETETNLGQLYILYQATLRVFNRPLNLVSLDETNRCELEALIESHGYY
jgi:hypothetical protein